MSRTEKIPSLDDAGQAPAEDASNALAVVAYRARVLGISDEAWANAADVLDTLALAIGAGDFETLAKMAELARKAERARADTHGPSHRRELVAELQAWSGVSPPVEAVAELFLDRAQNLALSLGARGKPDESYLREDVIARVAEALKKVLPGCHGKEDQGATLARAGIRALGVAEKTARSRFDLIRRDRHE
jgi:hypothetical protein